MSRRLVTPALREKSPARIPEPWIESPSLSFQALLRRAKGKDAEIAASDDNIEPQKIISY
jgi:hypothetical protein